MGKENLKSFERKDCDMDTILEGSNGKGGLKNEAVEAAMTIENH